MLSIAIAVADTSASSAPSLLHSASLSAAPAAARVRQARSASDAARHSSASQSARRYVATATANVAVASGPSGVAAGPSPRDVTFPRGEACGEAEASEASDASLMSEQDTGWLVKLPSVTSSTAESEPASTEREPKGWCSRGAPARPSHDERAGSACHGRDSVGEAEPDAIGEARHIEAVSAVPPTESSSKRLAPQLCGLEPVAQCSPVAASRATSTNASRAAALASARCLTRRGASALSSSSSSSSSDVSFSDTSSSSRSTPPAEKERGGKRCGEREWAGAEGRAAASCSGRARICGCSWSSSYSFMKPSSDRSRRMTPTPSSGSAELLAAFRLIASRPPASRSASASLRTAAASSPVAAATSASRSP
mmetsp:Transcript_5452/g.18100  ORF Transcript_5452/g.18100 Transcript_5452/m.18100 type:complete len:369 (-) Transcript_5452:191-1297(-)